MTNNLDLDAILAECDGLNTLKSPLKKQLLERSTLKTFAKKEVLWRMAEQATEVYLQLSGLCHIKMINSEGNEAFSGISIRSALIGEAEVIAHRARFNEVLVVDNAAFLAIPADFFLYCLDNDPAFCRSILSISNDRFIATLNLLYKTQISSLQVRLAHVIWLLLLITKVKIEPGVMIPFKISQDTLASFVGVSRPVLNQIITTWKREGILDASYGKLVIHNPDEIRTLITS